MGFKIGGELKYTNNSSIEVRREGLKWDKVFFFYCLGKGLSINIY